MPQVLAFGSLAMYAVKRTLERDSRHSLSVKRMLGEEQSVGPGKKNRSAIIGGKTDKSSQRNEAMHFKRSAKKEGKEKRS